MLPMEFAGEASPLIADMAPSSRNGTRRPQEPQDSPMMRQHPTVKEEIIDILSLAVPIVVSMFSFVGMKTTDSAILGHVSPESLAAAGLSDLWTMCSGIFVQARALDILIGHTVGANNPKLAGIYLQVAYAVLSVVSVLVFVAWNWTERVWKGLGSDPNVCAMAGYYSSVLSLSIPGQLAFTQVSQFFSAQRIMHPEVNVSLFALVCNLALGVFFVLGIPLPGWKGFGFAACPWVTTCVVYVQLFLLWYIYIDRQKLHERCWGGWNLQEITWPRIQMFSALYFPAAFAVASDFWRVAVVGAVAATMGELEVAVFNTSYRIMWVVMVVALAFSGASGINMSIRLGRMDPEGAKHAGQVGVGLTSGICLLVGLVVWAQIRWFGRIFTNDEAFLEKFIEAKTPFCIALVLMNVAVALEKIPYSMGRTNEVFWYSLLASWGGQVPAVIACTTYWRNDLVGLYTGMALGYGLLVLVYGLLAFRSNWHKYAELAQLRSKEL